MSASVTTEGATTTAITLMEVTLVPVMMAMTVMDILVKVGKFVSDSATTKK